MGILNTLQRPTPSADVNFRNVDPLDPFWYSDVGYYSRTFANFPISPDTAQRVSAVFACVSLLAEVLASVPVVLYRRLPNGDKERARDDRRYATIRRRPNQWMTRIDFYSQGQTNVGLRGNHYARIIDDGRSPVELLPLDPARMTVEQLDSNRLRYKYRDRDGEEIRYLQDEILHVRDTPTDGMVGQARAMLAREAIAVSAAGEAFVGGFFKNDATGRIAFEHPGHLSPDKRTEFMEYVQSKWAGWQNRSRPMLLWGGVTAKELGGDGDKNFIIDPRRFQVSDIARFWRVPGFLIGLEEKSTSFGTGIEQQVIGFETFTLKTWADRWAEALLIALFDEAEQEEFFIEFEFNDLLRANLLQRAQAYQILRNVGALNPNEIRRKENMNRREDPEGETYLSTPTGAAPNSREPGSGANATMVPAPLLVDAGHRIAKEDTRAVERRAAKADGDLEKWRTWLLTHYDRQVDHVRRVLAPHAAAYGVGAGLIELIASDVATTGRAALADGVPEGWSNHRPTQIVEILQDRLQREAVTDETT